MIYGNTSSCAIVGHGTISEYQCRLGYQILSEDTSTNTRQVKLQLEVRTISSTYTTWGVSQTPTIDGAKLNSTTINLRTVNAWQVLGTRVITIIGAFNGTKTGSFVVNTNAEYALKSGSASVTINLDDLHTPPIINNVDLVERNTLLQNYTGIAQYLSLKNITFNTSTYDDATISSYQVHHNGVLIGSSTSNGLTINFDEVGTLATFEMNEKSYCTLKFVVIDSYGTSSSLEQQIEVTKYNKPNLVQTSSNVKRNGQLTGKVKLNLVGTFFNQSVNEINNTISLKFAYWKKGDPETTTYYDIPFEAIDNNIDLWEWYVEINGEEITDVSKDYAYNFKIKATDHFGRESEITLLCPVGEYLWAEFKDRVDFKEITIQGASIRNQLRKHYIMASRSSAYSIPTANTILQVPFDKKIVSTGNLSLSNGSIVVGAGITRVKVSMTMCVAPTSNGAFNGYIRKNGGIVRYISSYVHGSAQNTVTVADYVVDVVEGDTISIGYYGRLNDSINAERTHVYVEAI